MAQTYDAKSITVLEGLEAVRKRPAMYIGSTGKPGLHKLVDEVVDNSVDEALAGYCKNIKVTINIDGSVTVEDDGRGIPVDIHPQMKVPAVEVALTKLHAGGKFDKDSYKVSGGLHGVGVSVVNALSKKLIVEIKRDGKIHKQEYSRGNPKTKLAVVGACKKEETGTKVTFWPDEEIFSTVKIDYSVLETRFREIAFLNAGIKISLFDEARGKKIDFLYSGGLVEFIKWVNESKEVLHKPIYFKREQDNSIIEIAVQYNSTYQENIFGFVNVINTVEGGTHVSGFKTALTRVINDYGKKTGMLKNESLTGDDIREGLTAIISIKIPEPQFEGQTKTKLGNSEVKGLVDSITSSALSEFFEENPTVAKKIISKSLETAMARLAAKKAKDLVRRKNVFSLGGLPGKLADCSRKSSDTEVYIVEGESAGGSAKQARNKEDQAILPLKGKILNVEKSNPSKTLSSEEITNLITVVGTGVGEQFNIEKLRYKKVIIMTDADVDGEHIKTLLLTFFFRFMPKLIENGNIYVALPPLYRIRKGQKDFYVYTDEELKKETDKMSGNVLVTRFKGLGEMSSEQLWETTMNPKTRTIKKIFIEDALEADKTFSMLMGDDVQARKNFISENAREANLDI